MPFARYREKAHAAPGERGRAFGGVTKNAGNFSGGVRGFDHAIDSRSTSADSGSSDLPPESAIERSEGPRNESVDPGRVEDRLEIFERCAGFDHRERDNMIVGLAQVDRLGR